jgi:hypothetical protein
MLLGDRQTVTRELRGYPTGALLMGVAVHHTGPEVALLLTEGIGTIGTEHRTHGLESRRIIVRGRLLAKPARHKYKCQTVKR